MADSVTANIVKTSARWSAILPVEPTFRAVQKWKFRGPSDTNHVLFLLGKVDLLDYQGCGIFEALVYPSKLSIKNST